MKRVVSVTLNDDGSIKGLLFEGNKSVTPMKTVIRMLTDGRDIDLTQTDLEVVNRASGPYVRKKANETTEDNLGTMAEAVRADENARDEAWGQIQEAEQKSPGMMKKLLAWIRSL